MLAGWAGRAHSPVWLASWRAQDAVSWPRQHTHQARRPAPPPQRFILCPIAVPCSEVTHRHLAERPDDWWAGQLGRRCLHFTWAARGAISLEGLGLEVTPDPAQVSSWWGWKQDALP